MAYKLQDALYFFRSDLIFSLLPGLSLPKKGAATSEKTKKTTMSEPSLPPRSPDCAPHKVTHAEINLAQAAPHSPMCPDKSPAANLFGGSLGFTLNKRQSIAREKSGHAPARKKHVHMTCRASSVWAHVTIQEALSAEMSSLHIDNSLSGRVKLSDYCRTMIVTPDGDEDDEQRIDDSADDSDYDDAPVAYPNPKLLPT